MKHVHATCTCVMPRKHVQAELESHEYDAFQRVAEAARLTVKEGAREAILAWVRQQAWKDDPLFGVVGVGRSKGRRRTAEDHDQIYDED